MSNPRADNATLLTPSSTKRYILATKEGTPLDRQIYRTYQTYTGTGGTVVYDGSNELIIFANSLVSTLFVELATTAQQARNLNGRLLNVHVAGTTAQNVVLQSGTALMQIVGTNTSTNNFVLAGGSMYKSVSIYFHSQNIFMLDLGSSNAAVSSVANVGTGTGTIFRDITAGTINLKTLLAGGWIGFNNNANDITITNVCPVVYNVANQYTYNTRVLIGSSFSIVVKDTRTYNVVLSSFTDYEEGQVTLLNGPIVGPTSQTINFLFTPALRRAMKSIIRFNITTSIGGFLQNSPCEVEVYPNLDNVNNAEYMCGPYFVGDVGMYDPLHDPGVVRYATQEQGMGISLGANVTGYAVSIQDNVAFYTTKADRNIRWYSFSDQSTGILLNLAAAALSAHWTAGALVADIDYDERNSLLYVLPAVGNQRLCIIPILPFDVYTGVMLTGPVTSRTMPYAATDTMYSIAVSQNTEEVFFSRKPNAANITITSLIPNGSTYVQTAAFVTVYAFAAPCKIMFGNKGTFIATFEDDNSVWTLDSGNSLSSGLSVQYNLILFMWSISRNGYGHYPV